MNIDEWIEKVKRISPIATTNMTPDPSALMGTSDGY